MTEKKTDTQTPYIVVYDDLDKVYSKTIWSLLTAQNVQIKDAATLSELNYLAPDALMVVIPIHSLDNLLPEIPRMKQENSRIVCDLIAFFPPETKNEYRIAVLAEGYDGVFNSDFIDYPVFKKLISHRINKGRIGLENRRQQEEYKRFKSALAASPDAFIVLDEDNKLFFVSEHYKTAYPKNKDRLVRGMDILEAYDILSAEQGVFPGDPRYEEMKSFWSNPEGQIEFATSDGRIWRLTAQHLPDGHGTIVTTTDITQYLLQKKKLELQSEALCAALEQEKQSSEVQKQFVNMVSHEFRTPLTIIDGHAQILQRRAAKLAKEDIEERAGVIRSAISRLIGMMEGILSSNMLQSGKMNVVYQDTLIKGLLDDLCNEHVTLNKNVIINRNYSELPDILFVDPKIITLSAGNVLSNAVKYADGKVIVDLIAYLEGDELIIEISDNGIGIPDNEIDKIFKRFFRSSVSAGIPGTGIGLNLCKSLVELHGGYIDVSSKLGEGTTFVIHFKIAQKD